MEFGRADGAEWSVTAWINATVNFGSAAASQNSDVESRIATLSLSQSLSVFVCLNISLVSA